MNKKKLKKEHHAQIYNMCSQRLKKRYLDAFYKDHHNYLKFAVLVGYQSF